jgi:hypothetical protein
VEIHVAPGNHDDGSGGTLYTKYVNSFCYGIHRVSEGVTTKQGEYPPFNPVIQNVDQYCKNTKPTSKDRQYVFDRGNIRFIMLDMPFYRNDQDKIQWFIDQVCAPNDQSITIVFTHECAIYEGGDDQLIQAAKQAENICPDNNLAAAFTGHGHEFKHVHVESIDVHFLQTEGMWWIRTNDYDKENDVMFADVYSDRIEFFQSIWHSTEPDYGPPRKFLTINGEFEDYIHPNDPSANLTTQMMTIPKGLNIVTFPLDRDGGAAKLMESVEGSGATISSIANFNSGSWEIYKKIGQDYTGTNFDIDAQTGYFVLSDREVTFEWEGYQGVQDPGLELTQGWNLVKAGDFYTDAQEMVTELAQGEEYGYVSVFTYEDGQYKGVIHDGGIYGHTFALQEGQAYFVRVE